jgi:exodeoxyribonuclease V alpha subunit
MSVIHGLLERISYHNEENDFVVAKLLEKEKKELTTIVGNLSGINPGEFL